MRVLLMFAGSSSFLVYEASLYWYKFELTINCTSIYNIYRQRNIIRATKLRV